MPTRARTYRTLLPRPSERKVLRSLLLDGELDGGVSSFSLCLREARKVSWRNETTGALKGAPVDRPAQGAEWAGALLYLVLVDQVSASFTFERELPVREDAAARFKRALREHLPPTKLPAEHYGALWALRNSFAHNFSVINPNKAHPEDQHVFDLVWHEDRNVPHAVYPPPQSAQWNGAYPQAAGTQPTRVNLRAVERLAEALARSVINHAKAEDLRLVPATWNEYIARFKVGIYQGSPHHVPRVAGK